jgi:hypothetical protein
LLAGKERWRQTLYLSLLPRRVRTLVSADLGLTEGAVPAATFEEDATRLYLRHA